MLNYDAIGEKIKKAREEVGLSQRRLAELLGLSHPAINHYENGRREVSIDMLSRIAKITGKPLSYFLGEDYAKLSPQEEERIIQEKMARMLNVKNIPVIGPPLWLATVITFAGIYTPPMQRYLSEIAKIYFYT